jgi:hypothetical protein
MVFEYPAQFLPSLNDSTKGVKQSPEGVIAYRGHGGLTLEEDSLRVCKLRLRCIG